MARPHPPSLLRRPLAALAGLLLCACGGTDLGGSGTLTRGADGAPSRLELAGTPREQGLWQGRLLRPEILAFHEAYQRSVLARDGDLLSPATKARRAALLRLIEPARLGLPEAARQELEGLSEGCGLPVPTLLLSELLTEVLRFTDAGGPLLEGRLERPSASEAWWTPGGELADLIRPRLLWITRHAVGPGASVTVLAWPGSIGGRLAVRADGLALLAVEEPLEQGRQALAGAPFSLSLRLAAERAPDAAAALQALNQGTAQRVLALDLARGTGLEALVALVGEDPQPLAAPGAADGTGAFGLAWSEGAAWLLARPSGGALVRARVP